MSTVVLDNEAVQALLAVDHPKRKQVLTMLDGRSQRARRRRDKASRWVPTTVRSEAGWDRTDPRAATINRLRIQDGVLGTAEANAAAQLVATHGVSPADAHLGATVHALSTIGRVVTVLTSDPDDVALVCAPHRVHIVSV